MFALYLYTDLPAASIVDVTSDSISLTWNEPPPALTGDLQRAITQYAVTVKPEDGDGLSYIVPAQAGTGFIFNLLEPDTVYDVQISAVIYTERQGEVTFDIGTPSLNATTCKKSFLFGKHNYSQC